jgi:hypothetical protein
MNVPKIDWPLRVGLLLVSLSLFSYMLYEFVNGFINRGPLTVLFIYLTDVPQGVGMGFRTAAGLIAAVSILFYVVKRDLSKPEALMAARFVVLFEAGYWISFLPAGILGLYGFTNPSSTFAGLISGLMENTLPCLLQSIVLVAVLVKLFLELSPKKSLRGVIKWALIAGTVYVFAFWLNNTGNWLSAVISKGTDYLLLYPANLFSFLITTVGLLVLAIYAAYFTKRTIGADSIVKVNLHKVGVIVTLVGMYFLGLYVMWLFLGSVGGWGTWYAWLLGHNLDLWAMSLPLVGLPLLFRKRDSDPIIQT